MTEGKKCRKWDGRESVDVKYGKKHGIFVSSVRERGKYIKVLVSKRLHEI